MEEKEFIAPEFKGDPKYQNIWATAYACLECIKDPTRTLKSKVEGTDGDMQFSMAILEEFGETECQLYKSCKEIHEHLSGLTEYDESIMPYLLAKTKEVLDNSEHMGVKSDQREYKEFTEDDITDILNEVNSYIEVIGETYDPEDSLEEVELESWESMKNEELDKLFGDIDK